MSLSKCELTEILGVFGDALTRLVDCIENDAVFLPNEKRALLNTMYEKLCGIQLDEIISLHNNNRHLIMKRGNNLEHEKYIGLAGEITMDTDANTLRVHDGTTVGGHPLAHASETTGDWVVEYQTPTAENSYTWYRKYKSGWVEMGGRTSGLSGTNTIQLPIKMQTKEYNVNLTALVASSTQRIVQQQENSSQDELCFICSNDFVVRWEVTGLAA